MDFWRLIDKSGRRLLVSLLPIPPPHQLHLILPPQFYCEDLRMTEVAYQPISCVQWIIRVPVPLILSYQTDVRSHFPPVGWYTLSGRKISLSRSQKFAIIKKFSLLITCSVSFALIITNLILYSQLQNIHNNNKYRSNAYLFVTYLWIIFKNTFKMFPQLWYRILELANV